MYKFDTIKNQKNYFIFKNETIKDAIIKIKKNGNRTVLVIDKYMHLLGTLTEGDIQKGLLKKKTINSSISLLYKKRPKKINIAHINEEKIKKLFLLGQYGVLPVVDSKNIVKKVLTWDNIFKTEKKDFSLKKIDVVIMAGGEGKRLKPFTEILPKPLIPVNSRPMLEHIIENFNNFKFSKFHLVLNHQAELIKSYFKSLSKNYKINFFKETKALGTVGGVRLIKKIQSEDFIITNCDTLFKIDYSKLYELHKRNDNLITVVASKTQFIFPYGVCGIKDNKLISMLEKPKYNFTANTGLYLVKKKIINFLPKNKKMDMTDLIQKVMKLENKVGVYEISSESWTDLGKLSDLKKAQKLDI